MFLVALRQAFVSFCLHVVLVNFRYNENRFLLENLEVISSIIKHSQMLSDDMFLGSSAHWNACTFGASSTTTSIDGSEQMNDMCMYVCNGLHGMRERQDGFDYLAESTLSQHPT